MGSLTTTDLIRQYWSGGQTSPNGRRAQFWKAVRPKANWNGTARFSKASDRACFPTLSTLSTEEPASRVVFEIERPKRTTPIEPGR